MIVVLSVGILSFTWTSSNIFFGIVADTTWNGICDGNHHHNSPNNAYLGQKVAPHWLTQCPSLTDTQVSLVRNPFSSKSFLNHLSFTTSSGLVITNLYTLFTMPFHHYEWYHVHLSIKPLTQNALSERFLPIKLIVLTFALASLATFWSPKMFSTVIRSVIPPLSKSLGIINVRVLPELVAAIETVYSLRSWERASWACQRHGKYLNTSLTLSQSLVKEGRHELNLGMRLVP